jgi:DNA invertase Pin-like site-specific DNA recombinase
VELESSETLKICETNLRVAGLRNAGCELIYREKASGGRWDRPELHRLLDQLRKGDELVV